MFGLSFAIPGFDTPLGVATTTCVEAGQEKDLLPEIYGDYAVTVDEASVRASPGEATAVVTFRDSAGHVAAVTAHGAVTPGGLPTTYSGNPPHSSCSHRR